MYNIENTFAQLILCEEHKEILKYYCIDCDKYYCTFCIKNNIKHKEDHFYFLTLIISKSQIQELKLLIKNYNNINSQKIDEIINDIKAKQAKDLEVIHKLEEYIKIRYNSIVNSYENLKKEISDLKDILTNKY